MSALVGLENSGSVEGLSKLLAALSGWLRGPEDDELRRAFVEWVRQVVLPGRYGGAALPVVQALEGGGAMLAERVKEWTEEWFREGREQGMREGIEQGIEQGREEGLACERALLRRLAASRFGEETAGRLSEVLARIADPDRLAEVGDRIVRSETGGEFLARVREVWKPDEAGAISRRRGEQP